MNIVDLIKLMQKSLPFTGDRKYIRDIIDKVVKYEYEDRAPARIEELERQVGLLMTKEGLNRRG